MMRKKRCMEKFRFLTPLMGCSITEISDPLFQFSPPESAQRIKVFVLQPEEKKEVEKTYQDRGWLP
jgi:hypothetical protein